MHTTAPLLRQVRRALVLAWAFTACINVVELVVPLFALHQLDSLVRQTPTEVMPALLVLTGIAIAAAVSLDVCRELIGLRAGLWLEHTLGPTLVEIELAHRARPEAIRAQIDALAEVRNALTRGLAWPVLDLPWSMAACALAYLLHPSLGLAFAALLALMSMLAVGLHRIGIAGDKARRQVAARRWHETIAHHAPHLGAQASVRGPAKQLERHSRAHVGTVYAEGRKAALLRATARALPTAGLVALLGLGGHLIVAGELTPAALVASAFLLARAIAPIEQVASRIEPLRQARRAWRLLNTLDVRSDVERASPMLPRRGDQPAGRLVVSRAALRAPAPTTMALHGIDLTIAPGESIGIIGSVGAGKSALAALIAGAAEPTEGHVALDGLPLTVHRLSGSLRPVGYMPDDPRLIEGSVRDNIEGFDRRSENDAVAAAIRVGVHDLLTALPHGYDTEVGHDGAALSLRTRRAVALARAVYGNPRLVVLDEPEIGLDAAGITHLAAALAALKADGTGLVIATRETRLLGLTDRIVVLSSGTLEAVLPSTHHTGDRDAIARADTSARASTPLREAA